MKGFRSLLMERAVIFLCFTFAMTSVLWLLIGSVAYWVKHGWLPADTAGWVQALGSLLAVAVAVAVPAWQKRHEMQLVEKSDRRHRIERVNAVILLTQDLISNFEQAIETIRRPGAFGFGERGKAIEGLARMSKGCIDLELIAFGNEMVSFVLAIKSAALYADNAARGLERHTDYEQAIRELRRRVTALRAQEAHLVEYFTTIGGY